MAIRRLAIQPNRARRKHRWMPLTISASVGALLFANFDAVAADHALCGTVVGNDVFVNVAQGDDCSSPAPVLFSGSLSLGNILIDSFSTATLNGTTSRMRSDCCPTPRNLAKSFSVVTSVN